MSDPTDRELYHEARARVRYASVDDLQKYGVDADTVAALRNAGIDNVREWADRVLAGDVQNILGLDDDDHASIMCAIWGLIAGLPMENPDEQ